jgi:hypothetical protein
LIVKVYVLSCFGYYLCSEAVLTLAGLLATRETKDSDLQHS